MTLKNELDRFSQLFKGHLNGSMKATLRWVSATEVDWNAQTMTAVDGDGLEFFDVLLGVGTTAVKPVINTDCLIAIVEGDEATAFLLYADEAEEFYLKAGMTRLVVSEDGCVVERGSENLLKALEDFIIEVQKVVVVVGTTPNVAALEAIKNRMKVILK
jgi:hypothetical protein